MTRRWTRRAKRWLRRHSWLVPRRISAGLHAVVPWVQADWEPRRPAPRRARPRRAALKTTRAALPSQVVADYRIVTVPALPESVIVPAYGARSPAPWQTQLTASNPPVVLNRLVDLGVDHLVGRVKTDLKHRDYTDAFVSGVVALWIDSLKK
jgi:hypothetical protein